LLELEGDGCPWLDITMSCAKTAEPIEMEFGVDLGGSKESCVWKN